MLEELAKKDKYWRQTALYICKDKSLADDLVQEMYIKLANVEKQINDFYVILTIKNLFLDICKKKKKEISYSDLSFLDFSKDTYEPDDNDKFVLDLINEYSEWWQIELLEMSNDHSLRELEQRYNINYGFIFRSLKKIKDKVWQEVENQKSKAEV